jgi:hypothetical protein
LASARHTTANSRSKPCRGNCSTTCLRTASPVGELARQRRAAHGEVDVRDGARKPGVVEHRGEVQQLTVKRDPASCDDRGCPRPRCRALRAAAAGPASRTRAVSTPPVRSVHLIDPSGSLDPARPPLSAVLMDIGRFYGSAARQQGRCIAAPIARGVPALFCRQRPLNRERDLSGLWQLRRGCGQILWRVEVVRREPDPGGAERAADSVGDEPLIRRSVGVGLA